MDSKTRRRKIESARRLMRESPNEHEREAARRAVATLEGRPSTPAPRGVMTLSGALDRIMANKPVDQLYMVCLDRTAADSLASALMSARYTRSWSRDTYEPPPRMIEASA